MVRIVVCALLAVGCGRADGVPDDQLGGLVVEPRAPAKVDVGTAATDPAELSRALALPYGSVLAAVGPSAFSVETRTVVEEGAKAVSDLADKATLEMGDAGAFKAVYTSSADYGREAVYLPKAEGSTTGTLFLRPRYQRWHGRAPETPDEPAEIRDGYFAAIAATWDLLAPGAELTDRGTVDLAGRRGRKIEVKLTPSPRDNPHETISQRRWRESRNVQALAGEIVLDAETGVPLAAKLTGAVGFSRDGRRFTMKLELDGKVTRIGTAAIAAPPAAEVVATPERNREVDERDYLLRGIAPPIRKNADGTALAPAVTPTPAPVPAKGASK